MGGFDPAVPVAGEPTLKYHPCAISYLTSTREAGRGTVLGGQFDWGGLLPKSNGGVQRSAQHGWQSCVERKGISRLNCETKRSNRCESRP